MFARIEIDESRCKGCALCTTACPRLLLQPGEALDDAAFAPVTIVDQEKCFGCAQCAEMCPDTAIRVYSRQKNGYTGMASRAFGAYSAIVQARAAVAMKEGAACLSRRVFALK
jgi:2-oxoglutarate ferredoxin oxidoreductase subunit delta